MDNLLVRCTNLPLFRVTVGEKDFATFGITVFGQDNAVRIYRAAHEILYSSLPESEIDTIEGSCLILEMGKWVPFSLTVRGRVLTIDDLAFGLDMAEITEMTVLP